MRLAAPWLAALATALAHALFVHLCVGGLWRPDAFDYAQIARELSRGHGFASQQLVYALHLRFLEAHGLVDGLWPNLHRFPLPSLAMALGFWLFGVGWPAVVGYGIACHAATAGLLVHWGLRAAGPWPAAAAWLLFTANGPLLESGCSGLAEPAATLCLTGALYALWRLGETRRPREALLAGLALGLAGLARTDVLFALPACLAALPWLAAAGGGRPRLRAGARAAGLLLLGLVAVLLPWWLRNWSIAGSPFFSLHSYFLLPALGIERFDLWRPWVADFAAPLDFAREHPAFLWEKWRQNGALLLRLLPELGGARGAVLLALLAVALPAGRGLRGSARLAVAAFALHAALLGFTDRVLPRYHFPFLPALFLLATGVSWRVLGHLPTLGRGVPAAALLGLAVAAANPAGIGEARRKVERLSGLVVLEHMAFVREATGPGAVILSDQSHAVAWLADRRSLRRHFERGEDGRRVLAVLPFHDGALPLSGVYLSRGFLRDPEQRASFERLLRREPRFAELFPRRHEFDNGAVFYWR